ncbi:uncharacterized protein BDZ99DRAFT_285066 [Mytilinidion resinicola]|uniref:Rhodopsin domain-containing protein n=1 Tax=Mytilinidion resinicola TaxID=574789 RepID=A0A6A6YTX8_9PEZI|nr:uncharacterized protein BDZ99DRAFT_285066 [Mytilinidion resinicola]KAF2811998.1 hypothetical protein BDZ99DRAFT_285066 [Mytilinidion resinicola]
MMGSDINLDATQQPQIWAAVGTTYVLAVVFVALRTFARRLLKNALWLDDWLLFAALASLTALLIVIKFSIDTGLGRHTAIFTPNELPNVYASIFKYLFDGWIIWTITITIVKFSVLAFYWRIFKYTSIAIPIFVLAGVTACWGIATVTVVALQCPREHDGSCRTVPLALFYCSAIVHIVTDASILALPLFYVFSTKRPISEKLAIAGMFMLGSLVVIIAIIRIVFLDNDSMSDPDITWTFVNVAILSNVECAVAIISACLPCLRPVCRWLLTGSPFANPPLSGPMTSRQRCVFRQNRLHPIQQPRSAVFDGSQDLFSDTSGTWSSGVLKSRTSFPDDLSIQLQDLSGFLNEPKVGIERKV